MRILEVLRRTQRHSIRIPIVYYTALTTSDSDEDWSQAWAVYRRRL